MHLLVVVCEIAFSVGEIWDYGYQQITDCIWMVPIIK